MASQTGSASVRDSHDPHDPAHAPEVADTYSDAPMVVDKDSEGLQAVHEVPPPPLHVSAHYASSFDGGARSPEYYSDVKVEQDAGGEAGWAGPVKSSDRGKKRKRWIIIAAVVAALVVAIALGVGLGVGLTSGSDGDAGPANPQAAEPATPGSSEDDSDDSDSPSTTSTSTASATSSAVTSGSTGITAFDCESESTITSSDGTAFEQECYTMYQVNAADLYNSTNKVANLGGKRTEYTLEACLDRCDEWNSDSGDGDTKCRSVSYYADLDQAIDNWAGNCFLKNARPRGIKPGDINPRLTVSAWMTCLEDEDGC